MITGSGGAVGTAMLQLGKLLDLEMYGIASKAKHDIVKQLGATPIDYRTEDIVASILRLTNGEFNVAFDGVGGES